jgi:AcrR family transcriptional regulator
MPWTPPDSGDTRPLQERRTFDEKLQRILKQASAIFAEKGYHKASIRDISAATGISLSGLYYYFRSKEELLFLIQSHCFETILAQLRADLQGVADPAERLRILIRNHLAFFAGNMREMKVLSHEGETLDGDFGARVLEQKREYADVVQDVLAGLAPERGAVDLRVATFSLFGMMNWIYTWYRPDRDVSVDCLTREMIHIFLRGFPTAMPQGPVSTVPTKGLSDTSIWREPGE